MDDEAEAMQLYDELCRIVGDAVLSMVAERHETKRIAIADVLRTQATVKEKWDEKQLRLFSLAIKLLEE
jgi:predicted DNA-binding protein YlxM (UPF0122 family)